MPTKAEISVNDESYMAAVFSPKMTMDEVGADIDTHGHIPVTAETATQDPFTAKGGLAYALDEVVDGTLGEVFREAGEIAKGSDTDKPKSGTGGIVETKSTNLSDPTNDFRDETKGEVEGITDTPQGDYTKPTIQQDKAVSVKDSLCAALDSLVFDSATDTENEPSKEQGDYYEGNASALKTKAPDLPESLGGDKADENGLVYITRTFTVDPEKYVSINYRPKALAGAIKDAAKAGKAPNAAKAAQGQPIDGGENADPNAEAEISDLGNPDGGTENEPTAKEEAKAAKEANAELKEEQAADKGKSAEKGANDELPESVVLDYATFLDGSSFLCFDESNGIDYSKIAMDAGPRKKVTRENCETTFEQCRAQNPLFCRFHGPKLLEADIRTAIIAQFRSFKKDTRGFTCSVTKDKDSKNPMSFRLTIGCTPAQKRNVEQILDKYFKNNPGIKSNDGMHELGGNQFTQEFDMDILRADEPPKRGDTKGEKWLDKTKAAIASGKKQAVVGETPDSVMQKLNGGAMPESAGQEEAMQPQGEAPEAVADNPQQLEKQLEAEEPVPVESTEPQAGQEPTEQPAEKPVAEPEQKQKPQAEQTQAGTPEATQEPQEATPEQTTEPTPEQPTEQPTPEPEAKPTEQEPEAEQTEAAKPQEQPTEQPQGEETAEKKTKQKGKKGGNPNNLNQYTYESYGEMPIEDPDSPDIGGTGDVLGSELLQYAAKCGGILKMPRGMGDYLKALSRWERAAKTGGNYKGVKPNALNRPTMNSFGITDPMADWIAGYLDGGTREKRPGEFHLLFGKRNKYGANDEGLDAAPEEIRNLFEQGGMQAVAEALLEAINKYKAWVDRATSHRTAAMNRAAQEAQDREDESLSFDEAELRDRDAADKEYDEALAEVFSYEGDSPTIRYFDRDKMKSLKSGDHIRFDHSDTDFEVLGYDAENDTLTVVPKASEDNPFTEEEKADLTRAYRVGEHGFEPVDDISPETGTQTEGATENESENKEGTGETGSGNAVRQNGGTESASGASGGTEPEASDGKPTDADIRAACRHIGSTRKLKAKPNYEEWQLEDMEDSDRMGEEAEWEMKDVLKGDAFTGFGMDGIPLDGYSRSRREEAKALLSDLPEGDSFQKVRKALEAIALAPEDYGYMPSGDDITLAAHKLSSVTGMSVAALKQDLGARVEGWTPITKPDLDFLTNTLGADSKVVKRLTDLYRTEGNTEKLEQSVKAADTALKGNPSAEIRETAESIKKDAATAKEQNRIADELTERLGTMKDSEGGLGNALTKAAIESAVGESRDKAIKADQKAADSAKRLQKQSEESYREAERKAKGEAAARVEQALTEMARGIFGKDSKSETIAEEADAVAGWMEGLAKKKGIEFSPSSEFTAALEGVKKESEQLEWLMGDLKKAMDVSGKDFQAEDVNYLSEAIAKKAAKIGRAFAELNGLGMAEIARINKAAELAEQKAKLEKRSGVAQTQSGGTSGRPSEGEFQSAAMELANSGIDTLDDAFAGLSAIVDGKVQGFGSMSSAEMTREMSGRYIEALEKGGDKFKPMVEALKGAVEKLPKEDGQKEAEPFALESVTAEQETAERKKRKEKAAIKKGQEAELHGSAGEVGQQLLDLGGAEGEDLFNRTARSTETAKPEAKKPEAKEEPKSEQAKPEVKAESETPKPEQNPEVKPEPKPEPKTETASGGSSGGEMDSRIEGIYKDWVEEPIPEWVRGLSADESKKYADMLEAARDWDTDDTNTAFEELTKYEETKSKEYEENKAKAKEEAKKREEAAKAEAAKAQKAKEEAERVAKSGHTIQDVMAASKRLGLDAFKPETELRRMLAIAKKLSGRDKRFEQRAKDLEVMLADREAKKTQKSTRGIGNYAGTVEDAMPKEALLKMVAEAVVSALEG